MLIIVSFIYKFIQYFYLSTYFSKSRVLFLYDLPTHLHIYWPANISIYQFNPLLNRLSTQLNVFCHFISFEVRNRSVKPDHDQRFHQTSTFSFFFFSFACELFVWKLTDSITQASEQTQRPFKQTQRHLTEVLGITGAFSYISALFGCVIVVCRW